MTIGPRFHHDTSYGDHGPKSADIGRGENIPLYKRYEDAIEVPLPEPAVGRMSLEEAIAQRHSVRSFTADPVTMEQLSRLLWAANGLTGKWRGFEHRSAPSAGALYPMDIYVAVSNVPSLDEGLYHFQVSGHSLESLRAGDLNRALHKASLGQDCVGTSPVTLIATARFDRVTRKYGDRGYRYAYMEAGSVYENVSLEAVALGLGTVVVAAFNDDALNHLLEIDGVREAALFLMPVGYPAE